MEEFYNEEKKTDVYNQIKHSDFQDQNKSVKKQLLNGNTIISSVGIVVMVILLKLKIVFPDFSIETALGNQIFTLNFTPIIWWLLLWFFIYRFAQIIKPNYISQEKRFSKELLINKKNKGKKQKKSSNFELSSNYKLIYSKWSFPYSRFIAALLLLFGIYIQAKRWEVVLLSEEIDANWWSLGGPSLFFPTAFITIGPTIFLFIYSILAIKRIDFYLLKNEIEKENKDYEKNKDNEYNINDYKREHDFTKEIIIREWRFGNLHQVNIDLRKINSLNYTNTPPGPQFLWLLFFGIHSLLLLDDGLAFLLNPFTFGLGKITAYYYLLQAIIELIALFVLLIWNHNTLIIELNNNFISDNRNFAPKSIQFQIKWYSLGKERFTNKIYKFLISLESKMNGIIKDNSKFVINKNHKNHKNHKNRSQKIYLNLTIISYFIIAFIGKFFKIYAGQELQYLLIIIGIYLIFYSMINAKKSNFYNNLFILFKNDEENNRGGTVFNINFILMIIIVITLVYAGFTTYSFFKFNLVSTYPYLEWIFRCILNISFTFYIFISSIFIIRIFQIISLGKLKKT